MTWNRRPDQGWRATSHTSIWLFRLCTGHLVWPAV